MTIAVDLGRKARKQTNNHLAEEESSGYFTVIVCFCCHVGAVGWSVVSD